MKHQDRQKTNKARSKLSFKSPTTNEKDYNSSEGAFYNHQEPMGVSQDQLRT